MNLDKLLYGKKEVVALPPGESGQHSPAGRGRAFGPGDRDDVRQFVERTEIAGAGGLKVEDLPDIRTVGSVLIEYLRAPELPRTVIAITAMRASARAPLRWRLPETWTRPASFSIERTSRPI